MQGITSGVARLFDKVGAMDPAAILEAVATMKVTFIVILQLDWRFVRYAHIINEEVTPPYAVS